MDLTNIYLFIRTDYETLVYTNGKLSSRRVLDPESGDGVVDTPISDEDQKQLKEAIQKMIDAW